MSDFEHIEAFAEEAKSAEVDDIGRDKVWLGGFSQVDELVESRIAETEIDENYFLDYYQLFRLFPYRLTCHSSEREAPVVVRQN